MLAKKRRLPPGFPLRIDGNWKEIGKKVQHFQAIILDRTGRLGFSHRDLRNMDFSGSILAYACFDDTDLECSELAECWFPRAKLTNASFKLANLHKSMFLEADSKNAEFWRADLRGASFFGANLENARLLDANLDGAYLWRTQMSNTELKGKAALRFCRGRKGS